MPPIETFEHVLAATALVFLVGFGVLLVYSSWRGRRLMRRFAAAHPAEYDAANKPWPVFFNRLRQQQYQMFLMQRGYQTIPDPALIAAFENPATMGAGFYDCPDRRLSASRGRGGLGEVHRALITSPYPCHNAAALRTAEARRATAQAIYLFLPSFAHFHVGLAHLVAMLKEFGAYLHGAC